MRRLLLTLPLAALAACAVPPAAPSSEQVRPVFFTADSAHLDDEARGVVTEAAAIAARHPNRAVRVLGYASTRTGSPQFNDAISEARARAVGDALVAAGVSRARVRVEPQGGTDPALASVESRRVDLRFAD